jgi:RimJ/RimL family protein N-acetyltransferase
MQAWQFIRDRTPNAGTAPQCGSQPPIASRGRRRVVPKSSKHAALIEAHSLAGPPDRLCCYAFSVQDWRPARTQRLSSGIGIMLNAAARYSANETLRDGREVEIRAFRPDDRADFLSAVERVGPESRYRRFFTAKRGFTEREQAFFLNVDFDQHVALVALIEEAGRKVIVGGGRYVVVRPGRAEVAFVVIDEYQGQGIGSIVMRHLVAIARAARLQELIAEVLPENRPMLKVFAKSGLHMTTVETDDAVHVTLELI